MGRKYLLTVLCIMFLGVACVVNAADTTFTTEDDTSASGFSVKNATGAEQFRVSAAGGIVISKITSAQRDDGATLNPVSGMMIFNTTTDRFEVYDGSAWAAISTTSTTSSPPCGTPFQDIRDGKWYKTVLFGNKCWMAQNLDIGTRVAAAAAPLDLLNDGTIQKYCFDNNPDGCLATGGLYTWAEAMDYAPASATNDIKGICPEGWRLPRVNDWGDAEIIWGLPRDQVNIINGEPTPHDVNANVRESYQYGLLIGKVEMGLINGGGYSNATNGTSWNNIGRLHVTWTTESISDPIIKYFDNWFTVNTQTKLDARVWTNETTRILGPTDVLAISVRCLRDI
ncbi:MAG: FISUMP domain-containing protein [Candidatus Anammoxibacter sp.]